MANTEQFFFFFFFRKNSFEGFEKKKKSFICNIFAKENNKSVVFILYVHILELFYD